MNRIKLLLILATMPAESFSWIVAAVATKIYPDGLGGFRPESRKSIQLAKTEALRLMESGEEL
jgi:hypothetical protein